jgi:hypothetical protein
MHSLHDYYKDKPLQECYFQSMAGLPDVVDGYGSPNPFPDIASRFLPYLGWAHMKNVLVISYEELVQDLADESYDVYTRIAEHITDNDFNKDPEGYVGEMISSINPEKSVTYRAGNLGDWRKELSQHNQQYFNNNFEWLFDLMNELPESGVMWKP